MALGYGRPGGSMHYRRPDERVLEDIMRVLYDQDAVDARDVTVRVERGDVLLEGAVPRPGDRWRLEVLLEGVLGVRYIDNRVRVAPPRAETPDPEPMSETHWTPLG